VKGLCRREADGDEDFELENNELIQRAKVDAYQEKAMKEKESVVEERKKVHVPDLSMKKDDGNKYKKPKREHQVGA